jgi:uncharacterized protein (DUF58 family)
MALRLLSALYRLADRLYRWTHGRFTAIGLGLLVTMAATSATANPDQAMGLPVFFVLASMLAMAVLVAPWFRVRFAIEREAPAMVTAGEPFTIRVRIRHFGARTWHDLSYREILAETPPPVGEMFRYGPNGNPARRRARSPGIALPALPAHGTVTAEVTVKAHRRGPLQIAGGRLERCDPLGIFRAFCVCPAAHTVLVMPRRHPLPHLDLPGFARQQTGGTALATGIGQAEEFVALREYRRGDALKHVHWRSAARIGKLVVKEYQDEHLMRHGLILDTECLAGEVDRFEDAVAVAASFACTVPDQESLLDLLLVADHARCITAGRGLGEVQGMLEVLAAVQPSRIPRLADLEALVIRHRASLGSAVVVLLAWDAPRRALVRRLKEQQLPTTVLLILTKNAVLPEDRGPAQDQPDRFIILRSGAIAAGLQTLGGP